MSKFLPLILAALVFVGCGRAPLYDVCPVGPFDPRVTVAGVGHDAQGASLALTNLDGNRRPELILLAHDIPASPEAIALRYKIGWNLNFSGITTNWSDAIAVPVSDWPEVQGAGVTISNLDENPRPDMVALIYFKTKAENRFIYKIGWNLTRSSKSPPPARSDPAASRPSASRHRPAPAPFRGHR